MNESVIDRLRQVRRAALGRGDLNLARECQLELLRYGVDVSVAVEYAVPAATLETAVHRVRTRPRPKVP